MRKTIWKSLSGLLCLFFASSIVSSSNAKPTAVPPYPSDATVNMFRLLAPGGIATITPCSPGDTLFGCTAFCTDYDQPDCERSRPAIGYPYSGNTANVPIETYYLLDVVSQEMNPSVYQEPAALQAQAVASRSYLGWFLNNAPNDINNSSSYQVFIPYKFDSLNPTAAPLEPGASDPCASNNLNSAQHGACEAIAQRYYIARSDVDLPAFAEFTGDALGRTISHAQQSTRFQYLLGVADPISQGCDADDFGNLDGLSQEGANRWARGNQCSHTGTGDEAWSVQWTRPEQILVHYYTGIHLRDANQNIVTPLYRWNPLKIEGVPPIIDPNTSPVIIVQIQNTGVQTWTCVTEPTQQDYFTLHARLEPLDLTSSPSGPESTVTTRGNVCNLAPGDSITRPITIDNLASISQPGNYWLRFDVLYDTDYGGPYFWFSGQGALNWPAYEMQVCVTGCQQIFLPLMLKNL